MGINSQGRYLGTDSAFKYRKSKSVGSGLKLGAQRKDSLEKKAIDDKRNQEQAKTKEISRREKERKSMRKELEKRVAAEETNPNRNTDERRKVANVGRPDTAKNPMDPRSKLAKQGEIKTKIIDENEVKSMNFQKHHNLPDDLVATVRAVMEKKNPFAKDDDKKPKKDDDSDAADDKKAKSKKDDGDDDADDQDEKVGTSGKKTKVDLNPTMKMANEEVEEIAEVSAKLAIKAYRERESGARQGYNDHDPAKSSATLGRIEKKFGSKVAAAAQKDVGGSTKPRAYGPGDKLASKQNTYAGYSSAGTKKGTQQRKDYMKMQKKTNEEASLSDEETARIQAKLNEAGDEDDHQDGPEHIVMQLRKAKSLGAANRPIHFHDGSKVKVASGHVQKALDMHNSFKKAPEKDEFTQKLQASHASFKKAIGEG